MADRKTEILDATQALLVELGGARLTMRKVAARVGISLGNVQYHFPKRDDLLMALLLRFLEPYEARLLEEVPEPAQRDVLEDMLRSALDSPEFQVCATLYRELWASASHSPDISDALRAYYVRLADFYRRAASSLSGLAPTDPRVQRAALVLLPMLEGYCVTRDATDTPPEELAAEWTKAIWAVLELKPVGSSKTDTRASGEPSLSSDA